MAKENDLLLNQLHNPAFNAYDFKQVGLDISNTSLEDKEIYRNLDFVKNNPLLQTDGVFDEAKFDVLYSTALNHYNQMAQNKVGEDIGSHAEFFRDNIYAPIEKRNVSLNYELYRVANPLRTQQSISRIDAVTESPLSVREIAQTQNVWDPKTNSWQKAPNDSWFDNWTHTRVMAQWDEEGDHIDPITGETVHHQKGDKKLNDAGTYYYENLNGRSVYGREVLSKFDTLTTDGSAWNKFDFFDSDDKKKSIGGTLVKNVIKVVPALIPVVSPWYVGMRVGINTVGLLGTLGNLLTGNSVSLFHGMEGFAQSMKTSQSDWVSGGTAGTEAAGIKGHAWSLESLLGMAGDVFTQLAEQRWLFRYPIKAIKGKEAESLMFGKVEDIDKARKAYVNSKHAQRLKSLESLGGMSEAELASAAWKGESAAAATQIQSAFAWAQNQLKAQLDDYQKLGKYISMAYMTGVTVQDSYGEALEEGATPVEAALLTLGYAIGEYKIVNSDLGKWILPELREEKTRWQQIGKVLASEGLSEDVLKSSNKVAKSNFINRVLRIGQQTALGDYMKASGNNFKETAKITARAAVANALGEGVEETSEELLYDFTKTIFNIFENLRGKETRLTAFDGGNIGAVFNRYALSFVGGTIGGGLGELLPNFKSASQLHKMTQEQAYDELIQIVKEGKAGEFLSTVDKLTMAPKDLSFDVDEHGNYKPVKGKNNSDSQDTQIKKILHQEVDMISSILKSEGADLENADVIKRISGSDNPKLELRALALSQSKTASKYLENYNQLLSSLVKDRIELQTRYMTSDTDSAKKKAEDDEKNATAKLALENKIRAEEEELKTYLDGSRAKEFIPQALFEMTEPLISAFKNVSLTSYAENKYHKPIAEISDTDLATAKDEWKTLEKMEGADLILHVYNIFKEANIAAAPILPTYVTKYMDKNSTIGRFEDMTRTKFVETLVEQDDSKALAKATGRYAGDTLAFDFQQDPVTIFAAGLIQHLKAAGFNVTPYINEFNKIIEDLNNNTINNLEASHQVSELIYSEYDGVLNNPEMLEEFIHEIESAPYISQATRDDISGIIDRVYKNTMLEDVPDLNRILGALRNNPNRGPILELLDTFSIATKTNNDIVKVSELITKLENLAGETGSGGSLDNFGFNTDIEEQIADSLKTIRVLQAVVNAARTDKAKIGDAFGFNKTVNELDSDMHLAEIDSNTADVIVQELEGIAIRLEYYKNIADIISGNKLREHAQTGVKTSVLMYDMVMRRFVEPNDFPPDDWDRDSINELKTTLGSTNLTLLRKLRSDFKADATKMNLNLKEDELVDLQKEIKIVEGALYKFFQANEANIKDINKLAKFLDASRWGTFILDTDIITKNANNLAPSATIWWLASIAAGNPEAFYSNYKKIFGDDGSMAPVAGQEAAVRIAIAAITNGNVFAQFAKAQNLALRNYAESHSDDPNVVNRFYIDKKKENGIDLAKLADSNVSVDFLRTILVEGIAGSGKSKGVARQIIQMLLQNEATKEAVLGNVWITHTSKEKAYDLAVELFGKTSADALLANGNIFSHDGLMQNITGTNSSGHKWHESFNAKGELIIPKEDIILEEGKPARYNYGINKSLLSDPSKKPTLIITDEVSHLSLPSLQLVEEFAEHAGIHHLAFGDFDQSGVKVKIDDVPIVDNKGNQLKDATGNPRIAHEYEAYAFANNFIHTFKLGQSLRTDNKLKDINNAAVRQLVLMADTGKYGDESEIPDESKIRLKYAVSPTFGLAGDRIIESNAYDKIKTSVKDLLDRTKAEDPKAKLGYIYDPEYDAKGTEIKSKITEILEEFNNSEDYKDMIDFKHGDAAQGDENPYYIINLTNNSSIKQSVRALYTGLTRAKKGSIVLRTDFVTRFVKQGKEDGATSIPKFNITGTAIKEFTARKKQVYDDVYGEDIPLTYTKYVTSNTTVSPSNPVAVEDVEVPAGAFGKEVILKDGDGVKWKVIQYNKDEKGNYSVILENVDTNERVSQSLEDIKHLTPVGSEISEGHSVENKHISTAGDVDNSDPNVTQMEHHTFNLDEIGLEKDDNGDYKFGINADKRFDNAIGFIKTLAALGNEKAKSINTSTTFKSNDAFILQVIKSLREIRSIGRYGKSEDEILKVIKNNLNKFRVVPTDSIYARFAYKVCQDFKHDGSVANKQFTRSWKERVDHLTSESEMNNNPLIDNMLVMVIIDNDGKEMFEVPICCDTNPITLSLSKGFGYDDTSKQNISEWVTKEREALLNSAESNKYMTLLNKLRTALEDQAVLGKHPQAKKLIHEIDLFLSNGKAMGGKIQFLTTTRNGEPEWLIPGRDWENSGIIVNTKENISAMDEGSTYAHYGEEWLSYNSLKSRGTMKLSSRVYMAQSQLEFTKNGRKIVIDPGKPFIIASDNMAKVFTSEQDFIEALTDDSDISTTFVYVEPMTATVGEYIEQLNSKYGKVSTSESEERTFTTTDIGNYTTAYRMFKEILKTEEGKAWILQRFAALYPAQNPKVEDLINRPISEQISACESKPAPTDSKVIDRRASSLLHNLEQIIERFSKVEETSTESGKDNELLLGLRTNMKDDGKTKLSEYPLIATVGSFVTETTTYGRILERTLRALVVGYPAMSETGISFGKSSDIEVINNVKLVDNFVTNSEDSMFKNGVYRHVEYANGSEFRHAVGTNALIEVASKHNINTALDPTKEAIYIDGKLDTGVLKTITPEQAGEYQEQKDALANIKSDIDQRKTARGDSEAYKHNDLKRFTAQKPDAIGESNQGSAKSSTKIPKRELINNLLTTFDARLHHVNCNMSKEVVNLLSSTLEKYKISELTIDKVAQVGENLESNKTIIRLFDRNSSSERSYIFTMAEVVDTLKNSGYSIDSIEENNGSLKITIGSTKYNVDFGIDGNSSILQLTEVKSSSTPKIQNSSTTLDSLTFATKDGKTTTIKSNDSFDKLLPAELLTQMKAFPPNTNLDTNPYAQLGIESVFMSFVSMESIQEALNALRTVAPVTSFNNGEKLTAAYLIAAIKAVAPFVDQTKLTAQLRMADKAKTNTTINEVTYNRWMLVGTIAEAFNLVMENSNTNISEDSNEEICTIPIKIKFHF